MHAAADDALDLDKVTYFNTRYSALDAEALTELAARRDTLADEAVAALDQVLAAKGVPVDALPAAAVSPPQAPMEQQVEQARRLWRSWPSKTGQFVCLVAAVGLSTFITRLFAGGAIWVGLITAGMGYVGYRLGRYCTREICADGDKPLTERRKNLWWFGGAALLGYFVLFAVCSAIFG